MSNSKGRTRPTRPTATSETTATSKSTAPSKKAPTSTRRVVTRKSVVRRHPILAAVLPLGLVVAVIATMVVIKAVGGPDPAAASRVSAGGRSVATDPGTSALAPDVVAALSVPASVLDSVGSPGSVTLPAKVGGGSVLRAGDGTPLVTYVGAEYCPYCAAERWALAVALSRFGTFSNLSGTHSSDSDVYPDTQTLSFYGSTYASSTVTFQSVEEATNQQVGDTYQTLQKPTAAQSALLSSLDPGGSIPFVDIANKYVITGASFSPQLLAGLSRAQIASQLGDASSAVAQAVDGAANAITAAICTATGNQPASVCDSPTIQAIVKKLGS
jgi:Domain of unknown function (DUF929)